MLAIQNIIMNAGRRNGISRSRFYPAGKTTKRKLTVSEHFSIEDRIFMIREMRMKRIGKILAWILVLGMMISLLPVTGAQAATSATYRLTDSITAGKQYVIVNRNTDGTGAAISRSSSSSYTASVTVSSDSTGAYVTTGTDAIIFTAAASGSGYTLKSADEYYLYRNSSNALASSTSSSNAKAFQYNSSTHVLYNQPTRSGSTTKYNFYYSSSKYSLSSSNSTAVYLYEKVDTSTTYYATLSYDANDGTGEPASETKSQNSASISFTVSNTVPTRSGYTFLGWADTATAEEAKYASGNSVTVTGSANASSPASKTLYAVWHDDSLPTITNSPSAATGNDLSLTKTLSYDASSDSYTITLTGKATKASGTETYTVDGYDKGYSYSTLNTGKYYYLYNGTYYQVLATSYYSSKKEKTYYVAYFTVGTTKYYLDKTPQAYTSSQLSEEHPGDDSTSEIYKSCKQSEVSDGKELPLYTKTTTSGTAYGTSCVLKDTINTSVFDLSGASITRTSGTSSTPSLTNSSGAVSVTGYDYSSNYNGDPLTVKITGLKAKVTGGPYNSNSTNAGIYASSSSSSALVSVSSPMVTFPSTSYTVTWKTQDGSETLESDTNVAAGTQPSYDGTTPSKASTAEYDYTFHGWATSKNQETGTAEASLSPVTGDVTYYAAFSKQKRSYSVSFYNEGTLLSSGDVEYGTRPSYSGTPAKASDGSYNYTFDGWMTTAGGSAAEYTSSDLPAVTGTAAYYAHFTATPIASDVYTVSVPDVVYDLNTGEFEGVVEDESKYPAYARVDFKLYRNGSQLTYNTNNYYFEFVIEDATIATPWDDNDYFIVYKEKIGSTSATLNIYKNNKTGDTDVKGDLLCSDDFTITLKDSSQSSSTGLTLTYDANGGSGAPAKQSSDQETETFTLSETTPTRSGYVFLGWARTSGATAVGFPAGGSITVSEDTTLYAVWTSEPAGGSASYTPEASTTSTTGDSYVTLHKTATPVSGTTNQFDITLSIDTKEVTKTETVIKEYIDTALTNGNFQCISSGNTNYTKGTLVNSYSANKTVGSGDKSYTFTFKKSDGTVIGTYTCTVDCNMCGFALKLKVNNTTRYLILNEGKIGTGYDGDVVLSSTVQSDLGMSVEDFFYQAITTSEPSSSSDTTAPSLTSVQDTLGGYISSSVTGLTTDKGTAMQSGNVITWTPKKGSNYTASTPVTTSQGNTSYMTTTFTNYSSMTYRVSLDTSKSGFEYDQYYDANDSAVLTYTVSGTTYNQAFPVPQVKITKTGQDAFYIYHDSTGEKEVIALSDVSGTVDMTKKLSASGCLYGGTYTEALKTPVANGKALTPVSGQLYYLREVPNTYLCTRNVFLTYGGNVIGTYGVAVINDNHYKEAGFIYNNENIPSLKRNGECTLYSSVTFVNVNGNNPYYPQDLYSKTETVSPDAKIAVARLDDAANGSAQGYWITPDNVIVTGDNIRKLNGGKKNGNDTTGQSTMESTKAYAAYDDTLPVNSLYVGADDDGEEVLTMEGARLAGYTTSLNGNIALNFYMILDETTLANPDAAMRFTLPGSNHTEEVLSVADARKQVVDGQTYYVFSAGVSAKDMTSEIKAQFDYGDGSKSKVWSYTVKEYADYIRNHLEEYDEESVALAENMLNYGGYAQTYFDHQTENMANAGLDLPLPAVDLEESVAPVLKGECTGLSYKGTSAMLTSVTGLRHYFDLTDDAENYTFTARGRTLTLQSADNGSYVLVEDIKAKDLDQPIIVTVTNKDGSTCTLTCSVYSNIFQVVNSDTFDENARNLMRALYGYGEAAKTYFATRD